MLEPKRDAELRKQHTTRKHNNWYNKLVFDRISGTYSYGEGLFIDDSMDGDLARTFVQTDKRTSSWAVSYTVPLSLIREWTVTNAQVSDEVAVLVSQQQAER